MYATEQMYVMAIRTWINSRVGTGSSEILSHFTDTIIAEKKNWETATNNNPKLSSIKEFHHAKMVPNRRGVCLGDTSRGDDSSRIDIRKNLPH